MSLEAQHFPPAVRPAREDPQVDTKRELEPARVKGDPNEGWGLRSLVEDTLGEISMPALQGEEIDLRQVATVYKSLSEAGGRALSYAVGAVVNTERGSPLALNNKGAAIYHASRAERQLATLRDLLAVEGFPLPEQLLPVRIFTRVVEDVRASLEFLPKIDNGLPGTPASSTGPVDASTSRALLVELAQFIRGELK
ncbi:MAG: hypothetical protein KDD70_04990 [Bdellovibrionales bacterium]|nr:hypothetical protein [Bdellovibrionales bacterium]